MIRDEFDGDSTELKRVARRSAGSNIPDTILLSDRAAETSVDERSKIALTTIDSQPAEVVSSSDFPSSLGRYEVRQLIGSGGFGSVYRAWDKQLERWVAVKIMSAGLRDGQHGSSFLREARVLASLDHPHIVPVYDVGQTDEGAVYIVSKYIDGSDLASRMKGDRVDLRQSVEIVIAVAKALHHAHLRQLVHRDVKPGNILLDGNGTPFLADFGLALRESDLGKGSSVAGTPRYMSPEQARREGDRLDGRSDIYCLGVVLYELLTGRTPFLASNLPELMRLISTAEVRPLRQIVDYIPAEIEAVCLKALCLSCHQRYSTAGDFAADLQLALESLAPPSADPTPVSRRSADSGNQDHADGSYVGDGSVAERLPVASTRRRLRGAGLVLGLSLLGIVSAAILLAPAFSGLLLSDRLIDASDGEASPGSAAIADASPGNAAIEDAAIEDAAIADAAIADEIPLTVERFDILVSRDEKSFVPIGQMVPLRAGDHIRFDIRISRPAFAKLVWMDASGSYSELFPSDPELGMLGTSAVQVIQSPVALDRGWPLEGARGIESAILLVSSEGPPRLGGDNWQFEAVDQADDSELTFFSASRSEGAIARRQDGPAAASGLFANRSLGKSTQVIHHPLLNLIEALRQECDVVQAISVLYSGSP